MNLQSLQYEVKALENKLQRKKVLAEVTEENNKKFLELKGRYNKAKDTQQLLENYITSMEILYKLCNNETNKYKQNRLSYVEHFIDEKLDIVFPDENFSSKIVIDNKYGSNIAYLTLLKPNGKSRMPTASEGKMCQQLLSTNTAIALVKCLGINRLFLDEAHSASSPKNLTKVGDMLKELVGSGIQIILIEQKSEVYKDLPRREIYITKNPTEEAVEIVYEKDI